VVGERVMGPPGEISGDAVFERCAGGTQRTANDGEGTSDQGRRPGKTDPQHGLALKSAVNKGMDILRGVDTQHVIERSGLRLDDFLRHEYLFCQQPLRHQAIFVHRVGMVS